MKPYLVKKDINNNLPIWYERQLQFSKSGDFYVMVKSKVKSTEDDMTNDFYL